MKFTQEDIENTIEEIKERLRYESVEHIADFNFNIYAKYWINNDFSRARILGLDIVGVQSTYDQRKKQWLTQIEVEYIGKHRIVMG